MKSKQRGCGPPGRGAGRRQHHHLFRCRFAGRQRHPSALFFVQIDYADGPCDVYQIPLALSTGADANEVIEGQPHGILATIASPTGPAVVHDACSREDMRQSLLTLIQRSATLALSTTRTTSVAHDEPLSTAPHPLAPVTPVAPVPITAQPGEAVTPPRSRLRRLRGAHSGFSRVSLPPPETPIPIDGRLDARASAAFSEAYDQHLSSRIGSASSRIPRSSTARGSF